MNSEPQDTQLERAGWFSRRWHSLRNGRGRGWLAGTTILLGATLASVLIFATGPNAAPEEIAEKSVTVSAMSVAPATLRPTISAYGKIESSEVAKIRTDIAADVEAVLVKEGQWVHAGQELVRLRANEVELRFLQRDADLKQHEAALGSTQTELGMLRESTSFYASMRDVANAKLARQRGLVEKRLISQTLLDEAVRSASAATIEYQNHMRRLADLPGQIRAQKAQVAKFEALVEQAKYDLGKTVVKAPFDGPILAVGTSAGERTNTGVVLVEIADADAYEVRVQIPEAYAERLYEEAGLRKSVVASINTAQGSTELQLARLGSQVRAGRTGIDAFFTMPVVPGSPPPTLGRVLNLRVALPEQPNVVAVPMQAIYDNTRVYVIVEDRLVERQIERVGETSAVDGDYKVLVRSTDLRRGDVLLTSQLPSAVSGMLVTTLGTEAMEQVAEEAVDIPVEEIAEDIAEEGEEVAPASSTGSAASSDVPGVALAVAP